mgnify:FL=1
MIISTNATEFRAVKYVNIHAQPKVVVESERIQFLSGNDAHLTCFGHGYPSPLIKWSFARKNRGDMPNRKSEFGKSHCVHS